MNGAPRRILLDIALTAGPKIAGGALMLLLNVGLIFVWAPQIYGIWAFWLAMVLLADAIIGTPFDMAVIRLAQARITTDAAHQEMRATEGVLRYEVAALALKSGMILPLGGTVAALALWLGRETDARLALSAMAAITSLLWMRSSLTHLQMRRRFRDYGAVETIHILARFGSVGIAILVMDGGPAAALIAFALGAAVATSLALAMIKISDFGAIHRHTLIPAAKAVLEQVRWYMPTVALGATIGRLDILMFGIFGAAAELGVYGAAINLASAPELVGAYLGIALMPTLVARAQRGDGRAFFVRGQVLLLVLAAVGFGMACAVVSSPLAALAPPDYAQALPAFLVMLIGTLAGMTTTPLALPLVMLTRQRFLLGVDAIVAPIALGAYMLMIPNFGIIGTACIAAATHVVRSIAVQAMAWRLSRQAHDLKMAA